MPCPHGSRVRGALAVLVLSVATHATAQGARVAQPPFLPEFGAMTPWELQAARIAAAGTSPLRTCELKETGYLFSARLGTVMTPFWRVTTALRVLRNAGRPSNTDIPRAATQKLVWIVAHRRTFYDGDLESEVSAPAAVSEVFIRRRNRNDPAQDIHPVWTIHMRSERDVQALKHTYGRRFASPLTIAAFQASAFDRDNEVVFRYEFGSKDRRASLSPGCLRLVSQTSSASRLSLRRETCEEP